MRFPTELCILLGIVVCLPAGASTFYVDGLNSASADTGPGTAVRPWKTISRAASAKELRPGDTVLVRSGVYRETVSISVSGGPGKPIVFAPAPGHRVVIKGSEIVKGQWSRLTPADVPVEPFPFAFRRGWKTKLGDEYFTDARFPGGYDDKSRRWVSQVFLDDEQPLQMIGLDGVYKADEFVRMVTFGHGLADMVAQSFYYDAPTQTLYLNIGGDPEWFSIEVGVRGFALTADKVHDVIIRGFEMRHNRQPGGQWPMVSIGNCERVIVEDCQIRWADFSGFGMGQCKDCVVRRCGFTNNGCVGVGMGQTQDCIVEDCSFLYNNYRKINGDWGVAAGMKNIPGNKRTTIRRCVAAYNTEAEGIWFDTDNEDIRILDNICHDNGDCGIFFEINKGGGIIAGNLVFANKGRGIYISGSQKTWVVNNTLVDNSTGIVAMTRAKDEPPKDVHILNNLLIRNYITSDTITRGSDITLEQSPDPALRTELNSFSDNNIFANNAWTPSIRHNWNDNNTLAVWQKTYAQDLNSIATKVPFQRNAVGLTVHTEKLPRIAKPLPASVLSVWKPTDPARVGANRNTWP